VEVHITPDQREEVERQLQRTDLTRRMRERLEMVKAAALGDDVARSARWSGRSVARVEHWLARFATGGVAARAEAPRAGRPVQADAASVAALETALEMPPTAVGLTFDVWTSERLAGYLEQQTRIHLSARLLRVLLAQHGGVCGRPKHTLKHLHTPAAVAAARAEVAAVGGKGARGTGTGARRAAFSGRDASGDQAVPVPGVASAGDAGHPGRRRDPNARRGGWQQPRAAPQPHRACTRGARHHRGRAGSPGPGGAPPG